MTQEQKAEHLDVHVAVCAERYKSLEQRLDRIERVMWWMLTTLILALGGMLFQLVVLLGGRFYDYTPRITAGLSLSRFPRFPKAVP